jgi:hypothetical protein
LKQRLATLGTAGHLVDLVFCARGRTGGLGRIDDRLDLLADR